MCRSYIAHELIYDKRRGRGHGERYGSAQWEGTAAVTIDVARWMTDRAKGQGVTYRHTYMTKSRRPGNGGIEREENLSPHPHPRFVLSPYSVMIVIGPSDRRYRDHILLLSNHMHWIKRMLFYGQGCFFKMVSCQSQETGVANDTNWLRNGVITHRNLSSLITWRTDWQESSGDVHQVSKSLGAYSADRICVLTISCLSYISIYVCRLVHLLWSLSRRWIVLLDSLTSFALRPWLNSESLWEQKKRSDREELPYMIEINIIRIQNRMYKTFPWSAMIRSLHLKFHLLWWLGSF